ncbi:hypothetical protein CLAFUW4_09233 [Fulvia fulva]|uniref:Uncharacterized protein n=1 Tax=Passalora fulva TaxID=5499 RepID=A0A9Q8PGI2_PASFU|nr:uncharacterized protein CLAFUR5_09334 [Fulvia fulva]KAK4613825.1 hypothetical protein CLAFUR4_09239 [Fulvia fulva]KAK4615038.1 hypothetical protein CLAFUR0_09231 [Fulvia fulva]UJO21995.1 hypothetical protein CLAFUR5_09334 [Fulvia fulva]WPV20620.1 hypothetical protein CLAFUW4_09233 [Fulvia fulva]WPV35496.1 hypothetical protein CLAFUW7_09234 [Fulvia fulva]
MASPRNTLEHTQHQNFLELPGELRNLIFEDVLTCPTHIQLLTPTWQQSYGFCASLPALRIAPEPALAQVCKALRGEVLSTYYSINAFDIGRIPFRKPSFQNVHTYDQYIAALRRWRSKLMMEPAATHLRELKVELVLSVRHEMRVSCFYDQAFDFVARKSVDGRVSCSLTNFGKDHCLCGLESTLKPEDEDAVDGRCLVDAVLEVCQNLYPANYLISCLSTEENAV